MKQEKVIKVLQLYPNEMNIYGDRGNVLALLRRLEWHGFQPQLLTHSPGGKFPVDVDIIVGGGGQDSGQLKVKDDMQKISKDLHMLADKGVPMLMICGLYQLFGRFFKTADNQIIPGISIFKAETVAGPNRMIGNVVVSSKFGELVGFENHSGQTFLDDISSALGKVKKGSGNNGQDDSEGAVYKNVFGSYMHGSLLPKNPELADFLIGEAVKLKYGEFEPGVINDQFALAARHIAMRRPR